MTQRTLLFALLGLSSPLTYGQAAPTATAPVANSGLNLGVVSGTFHYGLSASEVFQTGYGTNGDLSEQTNLSGSLVYSTKSQRSPFNAIYTGGVLFSNQKNYGTTTYQGLAVSQTYQTRNWSFGVEDNLSYLPQSPTVGLSGIPGTGDLGLVPVVGIDTPAQNIQTYGSNRISNTATGSASRRLSARTSLTGSANYGILHYFSDDLLNTRQIGGDLGLDHQLDARTSIGVDAAYSLYTFGNYLQQLAPGAPQAAAGSDASFTTRSLSARAQRQFSRSLAGSVSVGPQWVNSSAKLGIPSRLGVYANAGLTYVRRFGTFTASYSRGANGGSGVLPGAFSDSLAGTGSRSFGRDWAGSVNAGYTHTTGLGSADKSNLIVLPGVGSYGGFDSTFAGLQVTRRITGAFSAFASYTAANQTYGNVRNVPGSINGVLQFFSIGASWYPRSTNLGQF